MKWIILMILIVHVYSGIILPYSSVPIMIKFADKNIARQTMFLSFSLSNDLKYGQVIGFSLIGNDIISQFDMFKEDMKCSLIEIEKKKNVSVSFVALSGDSSLYCILKDQFIKAGRGYLLSFTFSKYIISSYRYFNQVILFTATSIQSERMLIDYNPTFGSFALYPSYKDGTIKKNLSVTSIETYPLVLQLNNKFDLIINLKPSQKLSIKDYYIAIKLPNTFKILGNISSEDNSSTVYKENILKGSLNHIYLNEEENVFYINGIEDEYLENEFNIKIKDILPSLILKIAEIKIYLLYKNTLSILSLSEVNCCSVKPMEIQGINISSNGNIYELSAWQIKISIPFNKNLININRKL